ncbi:MAG: HAD family hydrolase, partial [Spirochaetaceae bacterium]|nr:HAD family hydrolase [Spirochaetaceae bacterium]
MKNAVKAIAFDIDGTLYANWRLYIRIIPYVLKNMSFFMKYAKVRSVLHRTAPLGDFYEYQARLLALEMKIDNESAKKKINDIVYEGLAPYLKKVKAYPHIKETF